MTKTDPCLLYHGDCLQVLRGMEPASVQCCVTSPPYWGLRDYGHDGQIGLEKTPDAYASSMVEVFREVRRVLRDDGTLWLNLGDSYNSSGGHTQIEGDGRANRAQRSQMKGANVAGLKPKDLVGIPWRVAFALQADGWYLRQDIIWHKPNPMPESVTDRPTKSHEYLFLLAKSARYYYDAKAVEEAATMTPQNRFTSGENWKNGGGPHRRPDGATNPTTRNRRSVWTVATQPYSGAHFATFPPKLIEPCILAGTKHDDTVLDPFTGSGTTGVVAVRHRRRFVGVELNAEYIDLARRRIDGEAPLFVSAKVMPSLRLAPTTC